jgi:hypothetical protein
MPAAVIAEAVKSVSKVLFIPEPKVRDAAYSVMTGLENCPAKMKNAAMDVPTVLLSALPYDVTPFMIYGTMHPMLSPHMDIAVNVEARVP